jgi:hypothetical protein
MTSSLKLLEVSLPERCNVPAHAMLTEHPVGKAVLTQHKQSFTDCAFI